MNAQIFNKLFGVSNHNALQSKKVRMVVNLCTSNMTVTT